MMVVSPLGVVLARRDRVGEVMTLEDDGRRPEEGIVDVDAVGVVVGTGGAGASGEYDAVVAGPVGGVVYEVIGVGARERRDLSARVYEFHVRESQQLLRVQGSSSVLVGGVGDRGSGFRRRCCCCGGGAAAAPPPGIHVGVVDIRVNVIRGQLARRSDQTTREFLLIDPTDFPVQETEKEEKRVSSTTKKEKERQEKCLLVKAMFARERDCIGFFLGQVYSLSLSEYLGISRRSGTTTRRGGMSIYSMKRRLYIAGRVRERERENVLSRRAGVFSSAETTYERIKERIETETQRGREREKDTRTGMRKR